MKLKQELKFTSRNKMEIKTKEQVEGRFTQKFAEQANDVVVDEDEILIRTETLEYLERYKD